MKLVAYQVKMCIHRKQLKNKKLEKFENVLTNRIKIKRQQNQNKSDIKYFTVL